MTTFIFLRHAVSSANEAGILAGRLPGVELSNKGKKQAASLIAELNELQIKRVLISPQTRCLQTIQPWLAETHKRVIIEPAFQEMDYGLWAGLRLVELAKRKEWKQIQKSPASFRFPQGESFQAAKRRVERRLTWLSNKYPKDRILIVSHGDIIKMAVASTLNLDLDEFQRIVIDPASITTVAWEGRSRSLLSLNKSKRLSMTRSSNRSLSRRRVLGGGSGE